MDRVFTDDQISYFAELDGSTALSDGLRHYDYSATRRYERGDDALFRPLFFVLLAVENTLFSYHHQYWNAANLLLHAAAAWCLFRLLVTIQPSPFAAPAALLFTVIKPSLDLVVWNHLGGYILACLFLTIAIRAFVLLLRNPSDRSAMFVYVLSFIAAGLCHEAMVVAGGLATLVVLTVSWHSGSRLRIGRTVALFSPVICYTVLYAFHVFRVERWTFVSNSQQVFTLGNVLSAVRTTPHVVFRWIREFVFPSGLTLFPEAFAGLEMTFEWSWHNPVAVLGVLLCVVVAIVAAASASRHHLKSVLPILVVVLGSAFAYTAMICLARFYVFSVPYYSYAFYLLFVTAIYTVIDFERVRGVAAVAMAGAVLAFIAIHGTQSHAVVQELGSVNEPASGYLTAVARFVDDHKREPGFTFAIPEHSRAYDHEIALTEGYSDRPSGVRKSWMTQILFRRYYDAMQPKVVLRCLPDATGRLAQWTCGFQ